MRRPWSALLLAVLTASACSSQDDGTGAPGELVVTVDTTVGGATRVRTRGETPVWQLDQVLTLSPALLGDEGFADVSGVALDRSGDVWIADDARRQIRVFSPEGRLIRLIGQQRKGSVQFGSIRSIAFLGGTILVLDPVNDRLAQLSAGGTWMGERPAPGPSPHSREAQRLFEVGPAEVYLWAPGDDAGQPGLWVRHGVRGILDSLPAFQPTEPPPPASVTCRGPEADSIRVFDLPLLPRYLQHPAPENRLAVAWTAEYRVAVIGAQGDTLRIVERERHPGPVREADWSAELAPSEAFRRQHPDWSCGPAPARPGTSPAIRDLLIDVAGRLWVQAYTSAGTAWDVYDPSGRPLATVPSFDRSEDVAPYVGTEEIAWVGVDSLGVKNVRVARILR